MAEYAVYGNPRGEEMLVADGFSSRLHAVRDRVIDDASLRMQRVSPGLMG